MVTVARQALEARGQGRILTEPKTQAGVRRVAIPDGLLREVLDHIGEHCVSGGEAWLFANVDGRPWWRWEWNKAWSAARDAVNAPRAAEGVAGLPAGLHFHDLRHSGLTFVARSGVTNKELMARGGHASPTAALRYQHAATDRDREIADALGELFDAPRGRGGKVVPISLKSPRTVSAGRYRGDGEEAG